MTPDHRPAPARRGLLAAALAACVLGLTAGSAGTAAVAAQAGPVARAVAAVPARPLWLAATPVPPPPSPPRPSRPGPSQSAAQPLRGKVIGIDPGHNGRNGTDPAFLSRQVWNGREFEDCDTTGTQTIGGYTEARYNWQVASYLRADLTRLGARVVLTRHGNNGIGPCVNHRAWDLNHTDVAIDIHADGAVASGRGFAVLEPVAHGPNRHVIKPSQRFGRDVRAAFLSHTAMPVSNYDGVNGIKPRDDLAGLNLTRVPKVLIECGNMRNRTDAALLTSQRFQQNAARALTAAIVAFLRSSGS